MVEVDTEGDNQNIISYVTCVSHIQIRFLLFSSPKCQMNMLKQMMIKTQIHVSSCPLRHIIYNVAITSRTGW